ncbi:MAG: hypothetical protein PHF25_07780 [Candidatus Margulisbacteria bacterium]|nr:hypothetical protein [Candidatus Margulisiibacteriota bacterium]
MDKPIKTITSTEKKNASKSAKWSLVSISGIISLATIAIICLFVIFTPSQMIIAGWIVSALAVMGIAMAGAVIKA